MGILRQNCGSETRRETVDDINNNNKDDDDDDDNNKSIFKAQNLVP